MPSRVSLAKTRARWTWPIVVLLALPAVTHAWDWEARNLNPAGGRESWAYAVAGNVQVGSALVNGPLQAGRWNGSSASWTSFRPPLALWSEIYATDGTQHGGYGVFDGQARALLWNDQGNWEFFYPGGSTWSAIYGLAQNQQVGFADFDGVRHAGIWSGNRNSWSSLHPTGATLSTAHATTGSQQAGYAVFGGLDQAGIWSGTAASWTSLNPKGASQSRAYAITGARQAGYAVFDGVEEAGIWTGTSLSWTSLHPNWATASVAWGAFGDYQVGSIEVRGRDFAAFWSGTRESYQNLHSFLPSSFRSSVARGVSEKNGVIYVVGHGFNTATDREEALLWVVPEPGTLSILSAAVAGLGLWRRRGRPSSRQR